MTTVREPHFDHPVLPLDADHSRIGQHPDPHSVERFGEDAGHLDIECGQKVRPRGDDDHPGTDGREDRRVLAADGTTTEDEERLRGPLDVEDTLDIVHVRVVQWHLWQVLRA